MVITEIKKVESEEKRVEKNMNFRKAYILHGNSTSINIFCNSVTFTIVHLQNLILKFDTQLHSIIGDCIDWKGTLLNKVSVTMGQRFVRLATLLVNTKRDISKLFFISNSNLV